VKKSGKSDSTILILATLLIAFVASATCFSLRHTSSLIASTVHGDEWSVWQQMESYLKNRKTCTTLMRGHRRGDSLLGLEGALRVGREWQGSGWIVKDLYLLRKEDEVAWELKPDPNYEQQIFLKVSLIPKPPQGEKLGMQYLLAAPTSLRLIPINAELGSVEMRGPASSGHIIKECK
jgi:hypothetical protein